MSNKKRSPQICLTYIRKQWRKCPYLQCLGNIFLITRSEGDAKIYANKHALLFDLDIKHPLIFAYEVVMATSNVLWDYIIIHYPNTIGLVMF